VSIEVLQRMPLVLVKDLSHLIQRYIDMDSMCWAELQEACFWIVIAGMLLYVEDFI